MTTPCLPPSVCERSPKSWPTRSETTSRWLPGAFCEVTRQIGGRAPGHKPPKLSAPVPSLERMADSSLSVRDREAFLAEPHVAALSVSAGQARGPLTLPIWYQYRPGGEA